MEAGEVVDGTFMSTAALQGFLRDQIARAKAEDVLFSLHLKATMMKVSDPIIFGHAVQAFFPQLFEEHGDVLLEARASTPATGSASILTGAEKLGGETARRSRPRSTQGLADGPELAMVDSDKGITNLHVPSDVIVDASMPAMIRTSGHMWGPDGEEADTLAVIPDSSYAGDLPGRHRRLPRARRLRPLDHGLGPQRRPDGPRRRGVRQPRQDLRDRQGRHRARGRRGRQRR